MNRELLDPAILVQDCPEALVGGLRSGHATCMRFNKKGDLLASGRLDGTVAIFDLETNGVARKLRGHTQAVQSLSWSGCGRYLLSASSDWKCVLWDLKDASRMRVTRFAAGVFVAELHPLTHLRYVAALFDSNPVVVDIETELPEKHSFPSAPKRSDAERESMNPKQLEKDAKQQTTIVSWSGAGNFVVAGTKSGWLNVVNSSTYETVWSYHVSSKMLTLLRMFPSGKEMLTNSTDKIIRLLRFQDLDNPDIDFEHFRIDTEQKYVDLVNENSWNHVAWSPTGEYLAASIQMDHTLYLWETEHSSLQKILEGPREELINVEWHPHKPFIAALGAETGRIYLWSVVAPQKWSALAPDFEEVTENREYQEREDEFDIYDVEVIKKKILKEEDEAIDVLTVSSLTGEYDDSGFRMPVVYDREEEDSESEDEIVAVGAGQFRRKTQGKDWAADDEMSDTQSTPRRSPKPAGSRRRGG